MPSEHAAPRVWFEALESRRLFAAGGPAIVEPT
jgi:hypothetical protein